MSDAALVLRARGGDEWAFEQLARRYHDHIRLKANAYFLPGGEANDLIQEGRYGLLKAVRDYRSDAGSSFRNFAELCIYRQIITAVKTATRNKHTPLNDHVSLSSTPMHLKEGSEVTYADVLPGPWDDDPVERLAAKEEVAAFSDCLNWRCSELERRVAFGLAEGESYEAIAASLDVSVKAVDNAIQRVRRKMHTALEAAA